MYKRFCFFDMLRSELDRKKQPQICVSDYRTILYVVSIKISSLDIDFFSISTDLKNTIKNYKRTQY